MHEKDGKITSNVSKGWVSYWQPHADSELGTAIIANASTFINSEEYNVDTPDLSNAYANLKVKDNRKDTYPSQYLDLKITFLFRNYKR